MAIFRLENNQLYWQRGEEKLLIQPWGDNGLRVRVTRAAQLELSENWALLPAGDDWREVHTDAIYAGGQSVMADAPIDVIPLFVRVGADLPL